MQERKLQRKIIDSEKLLELIAEAQHHQNELDDVEVKSASSGNSQWTDVKKI